MSGAAVIDQLLSCTTGTWTGDATIVFTYQWQRAGVNIGSATSATYRLVAADNGNAIRCVVTGTNGAGNASANSNATAAVAGLAANFEVGVNTASVSTGDAGSATAWDSIGSAPPSYSNTQKYGTLAAKFEVQGNINWRAAHGTVSDHYGRLYIWASAFPSQAHKLIRFDASFQAAYGAQIVINTSGQVALYGSGNSAVGTSTTAINTNAWTRIEWHIIHSTTVGFGEIKIFSSPDSATVTETLTTAANKNFGASTDSAQIGSVETAYPTTLYLDNIIAKATAYPGPAA